MILNTYSEILLQLRRSIDQPSSPSHNLLAQFCHLEFLYLSAACQRDRGRNIIITQPENMGWCFMSAKFHSGEVSNVVV